MKKIVSLLAVLVSGIVLFLSCKKGDTGPAGTANVLYSDWMATNAWSASTTSTGSGKQTYYFDITEPKVTADIINSGTVMVYAKFVADPDGAGSVKALPSIYYNIGSAGTQYRFQYALTTGMIRIICDVIPSGIPSTTNQIRYVIIPGGASTERRARPDLRNMAYEEVCERYSIPQ